MPDLPLITSDILQMLVSSMTDKGNKPISELEAERFLNAVSRAQSGVPTGASLTREEHS